METPRHSTYAWLAVPAAVYLYDRHCPPNEMMSERADEWLDHPIKKRLFQAAVLAVALHLTNAIPPEWDIIAHILPPKEPHE